MLKELDITCLHQQTGHQELCSYQMGAVKRLAHQTLEGFRKILVDFLLLQLPSQTLVDSFHLQTFPNHPFHQNVGFLLQKRLVRGPLMQKVSFIYNYKP